MQEYEEIYLLQSSYDKFKYAQRKNNYSPFHFQEQEELHHLML